MSTNLQMKYKIVQKLFLSFVVVGVLINLAIQNVYACTPPPQTPWFTPVVSLISSTLPKDLFEIDTIENNLVLKNISDYPIFITKPNGYEEIMTGQAATFSVSDGDTLFVDGYEEIKDLELRNKFEDNRPANVEIPEAQVAQVEVEFDSQLFYVQLKVSYELNSQYNPHSIYNSSLACRFYPVLFPEAPQLSVIVISTPVGLVIILLAYIILFKRKK